MPKKETRSKNLAYYRSKSREWNSANKDRMKEVNRAYGERLKKALLDMYGDKCACCGDTRKAFLTLDHIIGIGGAKNRNSPRNLWLEALAERRSDKYQILCAGCNLLKGKKSSCPCGTRVVEVSYLTVGPKCGLIKTETSAVVGNRRL